jgi:16S rRNA (cytosine1402-N4)-methyltransferase
MHHIPVYLHAIESLFNEFLGTPATIPLSFPLLCIDGTVGLGGHSRLLYKHLLDWSIRHYIGIDQDAIALQTNQYLYATHTHTNSECYGHGIHTNFANLYSVIETICRERILHAPKPYFHWLLLDLGISSYQLDTPNRGFSMKIAGPLDMRMDTAMGQTALQWLETATVADMEYAFQYYGEEPKYRLLAKNIETARQNTDVWHQVTENTVVFAAFIEKSLRYGYSRTSPAIRIFQSIRMAINGELEKLETILKTIPQLAITGSQVCIITFHSIEDRLVKKTFQAWEQGFYHEIERDAYEAKNRLSLVSLPKPKSLGSIIGKEFKNPTQQEIDSNPRSRSAHLRIFRFA